MKFEDEFYYIEERLNLLAYRIDVRASLNLQDLNIHAESFFMHFLNLLYKWNLTNLNTGKINFPGVDLYYKESKILIQVSSTATKRKIEYSLKKIDLKTYNGYNFKFLSLSKDADGLRDKTYNTPEGISFSPENDILDIKVILKLIKDLEPDKRHEIHEFVKKTLSFESAASSRMRAISRIIKMLASDGALHDCNTTYDTTDFEIAEKITCNQLGDIESKIADIGVYIADVQKVYDQYDKEGVNKSRAVLHTLNNTYLRLKKKHVGPILMAMLADDVYNSLSGDETLKAFFEEDLRFYIDIILVDAFVRCKIFENPKRVNNGTT
ncbi:MAG: ABC-three component system protein [Lachnospiraceae bacterium]